MTRSSLVWNSADVSPISSRKIVPRPASANRPLRALTAPVNAPRVWPKSSDSSSGVGSAAQLTGTNGSAAATELAVNRAGDQLLAGAALAADQHRGARHRRLADELVDGDHPRVAAGEIAEREIADGRARRARARAFRSSNVASSTRRT